MAPPFAHVSLAIVFALQEIVPVLEAVLRGQLAKLDATGADHVHRVLFVLLDVLAPGHGWVQVAPVPSSRSATG